LKQSEIDISIFYYSNYLDKYVYFMVYVKGIVITN